MMTEYNAARRADVRRAEKAAAEGERNDGVVLMRLASSPEGRKYLWRRLSECHIFSTTFTGDPLTSAFREGERNVGLRLLGDLTSECPEHFLQMMREANDERRAGNEQRRGQDSDGRDQGSAGAAGDDDGGFTRIEED